MLLVKTILAFLLVAASTEHVVADINDDEIEYKPGAEVINAIIADLWPGITKGLLAKLRAHEILVDPYVLKLRGGKMRYPPTIRNMELISPKGDSVTEESSNSTAPVRSTPVFECGIVYRGKPDLDFLLTGADGHKKTANVTKKMPGLLKRVMRALVPDIQVELKTIDLRGRIQIELDMRTKRLSFFFVRRPTVDWDLEFSLTKAHIPLVGEDNLDVILTNALEKIDRDHPVSVKF